ncbi:hypothetical protein [Desulfosporosinus shakirovi]|uniref:hypothetical protein n=1 Tax=Desulfosporosinus shakirovi TaxID=2885154 RepID=UPI001E4DE60B|nr:hypothetical protein [Desulfosporosinus sp. SRJS8]MCB8818675.1 hypothetical protein [Desulfosporosinus sp. SRJS8]
MAKYTKVWENGIETSTLNFRGKDFTLTMAQWEGNLEGHYTSKEQSLENQIGEAFPDDEDIGEIIDLLDGLDDDFDREGVLEELTNFEKGDREFDVREKRYEKRN